MADKLASSFQVECRNSSHHYVPVGGLGLGLGLGSSSLEIQTYVAQHSTQNWFQLRNWFSTYKASTFLSYGKGSPEANEKGRKQDR